MKPCIFSPFLILFCCLASLFADDAKLWSDLSPQQQAQLSAGKSVVLEEEVSGNPWPRYTIYHLVNSSPEKVAAVFWNCELDSKYIPNCLSVRILSRPETWIHDGEYTLKMPFMLPNEIYVTRNVLNTPSPGIFEISWKLLSARYINGSTGNMRIEPHEADGDKAGSNEKAILRYTNLVVPGSKFAGLLRAKARNEVIESVEALVHQVESEAQESPQLLQQQVQDLQRSLGNLNAPSPAGG